MTRHLIGLLVISLFSVHTAFAGAIEGTVTRDRDGAPVRVLMLLYQPVLGIETVDAVETDENGRYRFDGLSAGTYTVGVFNPTELGLIEEFYDDVNCALGCDPSEGTPIVVGAEDTVSGIDIGLADGGTISGRVVRADDDRPVFPTLVATEFVNANGVLSNGPFSFTDENGNYRISGLISGQYKVFLPLVHGFDVQNADGLLAEIFDNIPCPCRVADGVDVSVTQGSETDGIDFSLELAPLEAGGRVTDANTGEPIEGVEVQIQDRDLIIEGERALVVAGIELTDADGRFRFFVPPGDYVIETKASSLGFVDEWFDDIPRSTRVEDVPPTSINQSRTDIDFALESGSRIQGRVTRTEDGSPVPTFLVVANNMDSGTGYAAETDQDGFYSIDGVDPGTYQVFTFAGPGFNLINELFDDIQCLSCNPGSAPDRSAGTPVEVLAGQTVSGIDFALDKGAGISGKVVATESGIPLPGVLVLFYDDQGQTVALSFVEATGNYVIQGLPAGDYTVRTTRAGSFSLVNEIFNGVPCIGECDPALGRAISLQAGDLVQDIDFALEPISSLVDSESDGLAKLGQAVAVDGDKLVVGAPGDDTMGEDAGAVHVYQISAGKFQFIERLFSPDPGAGARFGAAVAIENGVLVVGAPGNGPNGKGTGKPASAFVLLSAGGTFNPVQELIPDNLSNTGGSGFGTSVAIEGSVIAIGAPDGEKEQDDAAGAASGKPSGVVAVFELDDDDWISTVVLSDEQGDGGDQFGTSVDIGDSQVAVGAPMATGASGQATGRAMVFEQIASNWSMTANQQPASANPGDLLGFAVSIKGSVLIAGAPGHDAVADNAGAAFVFEQDDSGFDLTETILPVIDDEDGEGKANEGAGSPNGQFGISLQSTGTQVVIGASGEAGATANTGAAYLFSRSGSGRSKFEFFDRLLAAGGQSGDGLGSAVAYDGETLAVGAPEGGIGTASDSGLVLAASSGEAINSRMSGPWFNVDQSGHGWLIEVLENPAGGEPDRVNAYWYVYQDGAPVWLVGSGPVAGSSATLDMIIASGPTFPPDYDTADLVVTPWGTLTFDFAGDTTGTATWSSDVGDFGNGSLEMTQIAPLSEDGPDSCRSGSYFDPDQNGFGYVTEVVSIGGVETLIVAWFVYLDGQQVWMFGQGEISGGSAMVPMGLFSGADFPPDFVAAEVINEPWGTLNFTFTGADTAMANWTTDVPGYSNGDVELVRLTALDGHDCP